MRLSVVKPLHANWFMYCFDELKKQTETITVGWKNTGILALLREVCYY